LFSKIKFLLLLFFFFCCSWSVVLPILAAVRCDLDYFLEDIVQMLDFTPPPSDKKRRGGRDDDEAVDTEDKDDKEVKWLE